MDAFERLPSLPTKIVSWETLFISKPWSKVHITVYTPTTEVTRVHLYCESYKTMNTTNNKEYYCLAKKKLIGGEKTKPQTAMVISLWFVYWILRWLVTTTVNIFQVFMISWVWQQNYWKLAFWGDWWWFLVRRWYLKSSGEYILLVYNKTVDIVFRALWLATQSVTIQRYSLIHLQSLRASDMFINKL